MLLNIVVGLIIPGIIIIPLYFKDKRVLLTVAPFQSAISYTVNAFGFYYSLWDLYPFDNEEIVHVPYYIGLYPMIAVLMVYYIRLKKITPLQSILFYSVVTTIMEGAGVFVKRVLYDHGWNIGLTFISYLIPYIITYLYYLKLEKLGMYKER